MQYMEYLEILWFYLPYLFYAFVFLSLIPKSLKKINDFARADYEANRNKWHRCYAPDICCHNLAEPSIEPTTKQKPRKAVTRGYPKKHQVNKEAVTTTSSSAVDGQANIYKRQVHTHTNVNKIAKMFENGGVQKKINRVTPTVLPADFRRASMDMDDEIFNKKDDFIQHSNENSVKRENVVLRRLSKLAQELEENNENSANVLNQINPEEHDLLNTSWRSEPINIQRRKHQVPTNLVLNGNSATPSTISPAPSSPLSSPHSSNSPLPGSSSPLLRNAPVLNMNTSLEDLFKAIAKSAENSDGFLYSGCSSLSPVTSIDDILSQRRLSRPLSAYSISDLLNDEPNKGLDEAYVENFLKVLNKT